LGRCLMAGGTRGSAPGHHRVGRRGRLGLGGRRWRRICRCCRRRRWRCTVTARVDRSAVCTVQRSEEEAGCRGGHETTAGEGEHTW